MLAKAVTKNWTDFCCFFFSSLHKWLAKHDQVSPSSILLFSSPKPLEHGTFRGSEVFPQQLKEKKKNEKKAFNQKRFSSGKQKPLVFPQTN